jgi:hypothetical protein
MLKSKEITREGKVQQLVETGNPGGFWFTTNLQNYIPATKNGE